MISENSKIMFFVLMEFLFKQENEVITLLNKIDENWFEGSLHGRTGYFPVNYVKVDVPLP